jgi:cell division protein ZapA (FtsZ GTPase activity inhibitor)
MVHYWRLPKEKELLLANPFAKYQKYFGVKYSRYKDVTFNLPILCTKLKKGSYYSNCSVVYAYNKKTGLYDGRRINQAKHSDAKEGLYFALNHAKNFALVTPVRAIETKYDKIIFDERITAEEKLAALTTLLIQESLQKKRQKVKNIANAMASKAMHMIFGDPKLSGRKLYASTNDLSRMLKRKYKTVSKATFRVKNKKLYLTAIQ